MEVKEAIKILKENVTKIDTEKNVAYKSGLVLDVIVNNVQIISWYSWYYKDHILRCGRPMLVVKNSDIDSAIEKCYNVANKIGDPYTIPKNFLD